ncbi:hypothetical protein C4561_01600 [candidate division WWE3 bacterium]|uniref:Uncharacterized protein n=1 Tax=candidate division WWE3 bacterium TaxID=2053526 RepID=A0A3A4ZFI5_UNCKA|nr:MAG: hypothetical protein C4561_01600 [candidate division WWE3 bacterium]
MWEIGVAYPIYNHTFRYRKVVEGTLLANANAGASSISVSIPTGNPTVSSLFGSCGDTTKFVPSLLDRVVIGKSTRVAYLNAVEEVKVLSVSGSTITLYNSLTNGFNLGDSISLYGVGCPDGWVFNSGTEVLRSLVFNEYGGKDDLCSFGVGIVAGSPSGSIRADLALTKLIPNMPHELNFHYKRHSVGSACQVELHENNGISGATVTAPLTTTLSWTESSNSFTSNIVQNDNSLIRLRWPTSGFSSLQVIDCLVLQFGAHFTTGASYIFNQVPDSDVNIFDLTEKKSNFLTSGYSRQHLLAGKVVESKRHALSCSFTNIPSETYHLFQVLSAYSLWQNKGFLIALKTGIPELPPILVGLMELSEVRSSAWAFSEKSFTLKFEEVL